MLSGWRNGCTIAALVLVITTRAMELACWQRFLIISTLRNCEFIFGKLNLNNFLQLGKQLSRMIYGLLIYSSIFAWMFSAVNCSTPFNLLTQQCFEYPTVRVHLRVLGALMRSLSCSLIEYAQVPRRPFHKQSASRTSKASFNDESICD